MDYVSEESNQQARSFEKRFQQLRPDAGILFVSVKAVPCANGECRAFEVRLGVTRQVGALAGAALCRFIMRQEIDRGLSIVTDVYQGVPGAARGNTSDEEAGDLAS